MYMAWTETTVPVPYVYGVDRDHCACTLYDTNRHGDAITCIVYRASTRVCVSLQKCQFGGAFSQSTQLLSQPLPRSLGAFVQQHVMSIETRAASTGPAVVIRIQLLLAR